MKADFATLADLLKAIPNEDAAVDHFTAMRWKDGEFCPYCGSTKIYHFARKPGKHPVYKCADKDCRQRFSIKVGTIFEDTKIPLQKWMIAVWFITSHKKSIASTQLARDIGVTQKTAWFMMHRLRHAVRTRSFNRQLGGIVEMDETFVGGKARNRHIGKRGNSGVTGGTGKAVVAGAIERGGDLVASVVENVRADTLSNFAVANISPKVETVVTDKWVGYKHLGRVFPHVAIDHAAGEYVIGKFHTNSIEGYWSQLKRQIFGIHHFVSGKHLFRYVDESAWRHNKRETEDCIRFNDFLRVTDGRLTYKALIS